MGITKEELISLHSALTTKALDLMRVKNHDYTQGSSDPLKNFRKRGLPILMGRIEDKIERIDTFNGAGRLMVSQETAIDSAVDVINYMVLLVAMWADEGRVKIDLADTSRTRLLASLIEAEVLRIQDTKNPRTFDNPHKSVAVLTEELGEVAGAILQGDYAGAIKELAQIVAFATMWMRRIADTYARGRE